MSPSLRHLIYPTNGNDGYLLEAVQEMVQHPGPKVGLAAVLAVVQGLYGAITPLAVVAFAFWALDFASGIIRAIRDPDDSPRWDRAMDGVLKLFLYVIVWLSAALGEVALVSTPPHLDLDGGLVAGALGIVIWSEAVSIRDNVVAGLPRLAAFFERLLQPLRTLGAHSRSAETRETDGSNQP